MISCIGWLHKTHITKTALTLFAEKICSKLLFRMQQDASVDLADASANVVPAAVPETSSPGEPQSNGAAERSIQLVEDLSRTLKLCLEDRIGAKIPSNHPVLEWLVLYTGTLLTKCHVSGSIIQEEMRPSIKD